MKKLMIVGIVSLMSFTACNKEKEETTKSLADQKMEFQVRQLEIEKQKLAIEKERFTFEQEKKSDSLEKNEKEIKVAPVKNSPQPEKVKTVYVNNTPRASTSNSNAGTSSGSSTNAPVAQKKGISDAAKGTIIGTVGGAAAGAIISKKNRGAGAVIGGVVGGATGYTIGRAKDRKTGRVQPTN
ncbi:YMGG-like glycine zipper-containing protein [Frigoriflavimonas asaccharolytica]|uniref:Uncharacterized protein YcfJ n=1 Tax=Frigoriflavimonas asaccharolytica TaxID=2735899 RepID=A0A8J8GBL1_9FLAO|nr:YMGG-like glycine zipper-containing protein [Frigoriflavimonas asaccharolytica]NRS92965.1 uncharacterized protein YcfJ [Frigoriflavimonas asaccharolytica]